MKAVPTQAPGATAVVAHRVRCGLEEEYERWLEEIREAARPWPGLLDVQILRPVAGLTRTYVVVVRFRERVQLESWLESAERRRLLARLRPLLEAEDRVRILSGLDFWFALEGPGPRTPVRWKQALVTWSAIYPLVLFTPSLVLPVLRGMGVPSWRALDTLGVTLVVVALMVWGVMPRLTRLFHAWLFRSPRAQGAGLTGRR